jgi:large subunit ribosomal protein L15
MKLHDLKPAPGSTKERTRVGRGIAAGKGKTAGRGTKGQKARAGGSIPPWFEGGQTPLQIRIPKLRGFKNRFKTEYRVVNVGRIAEAADAGRFAEVEVANAPLTVNPETLRVAGLIGSKDVPVKILGEGEITRPLFVIANAFTKGARAKIEAAGGTAQVLEASDVVGGPIVVLQDARATAVTDAAMSAPSDTAAADVAPDAADTAADGDASSSAG